MTAVATVQKQRQDQQQVTTSMSLTLVKNLLRTGIASICYIRKIFDEEEFVSTKLMGMPAGPVIHPPLSSQLTILKA